MPSPSPELLQALAITAELTATELSKPAARLMAAELAQYPQHEIFNALRKCRRELTGKLTLAAILQRVDDGRPGPEEAWAIVAPTIGNEAVSIVWTDEMAEGYRSALHLDDDKVAARMAFLEAYRKAIAKARDQGSPPTWTPCLGHDPAGREAALIEARNLNRLTASHVHALLPHLDIPPALQPLLPAKQFKP